MQNHIYLTALIDAINKHNELKERELEYKRLELLILKGNKIDDVEIEYII